MHNVLKAHVEHGQLHVEITYSSFWPRELHLAIFVGDNLVEEVPVSGETARGGVENIQVFDLPAEDIVVHRAIRLRLSRKQKVLSEQVLHFRKSDRDNRPIVVSNRRPGGLRLQGWIVPRKDTAARLALFVDGAFVESSVPSTIRRDILQLFPETASVNNGFGFGIPEWCYDGEPHDFVIIEEVSRVIAENTTLTLTPADLREGLVRRSDTLLKALSGDLYKE